MSQESLLLPVGLALVGYLVTYTNSIRLDNRKARLQMLNDQIQYLYGPLFSLCHASTEAWKSFCRRYCPKGDFFAEGKVNTEQELIAWRLWMKSVFMPLNLQVEKAIIDNAHLIDGGTMPKVFLDLLAHVEVYKAILERWDNGDFSEHTAYINYPEGLNSYVEKTFAKLREVQMKLLRTTLEAT